MGNIATLLACPLQVEEEEVHTEERVTGRSRRCLLVGWYRQCEGEWQMLEASQRRRN